MIALEKLVKSGNGKRSGVAKDILRVKGCTRRYVPNREVLDFAKAALEQ